MPIEHILSDTDNMKSLAYKYLGDANRWYELVEFNNLDYPYIVDSREEKEELIFGHGYVQLTRANYHSGVTVKKGWKLRTKPYLVGGHVKEFEVTEDTYIEPYDWIFNIHVRSIVPGIYGNVSEGMVTEVGEEFERNGIQVVQAYNAEDFTGGQDLKILTTGDSVFIPSSEGEIPPEDVYQMLEMIGGEDLDVTKGTLAEDGFGDMATLTGIDNITQAITDRLLTEKGDLPLHPEYGTNIPRLIGQAQTPYTRKLVELEIYEALTNEDRIEDVQITHLDVVADSVFVELVFKPRRVDKQTVINLNLSYRGGNN